MANNFTSSYVDDDAKNLNREFICGVIEGFYGRPWTTEQRKDLFRKYVYQAHFLFIFRFDLIIVVIQFHIEFAVD